ncbi:MucB/RseB C-terminal domain-containing protein [Psychromonas ossibalaenae]|uniref:MucB/RseB C-terminal domain-containing protein n=1 Tax=Psychromonas ossibalaenae TaxID=444922 RepID=UPI00036A5BEB|nr:MucB/RseB C-terminal domain-containing protein [Psychromonas ossibalaenae]
MKRQQFFTTLVISIFALISNVGFAVEVNEQVEVSKPAQAVEAKVEKLTAIEYLQLMQAAYNEKNYEILYLNGLQNQIEPKQLIHGVIDGKELSYFRYLNGVMRESLQYSGKVSYFEQGAQAYTLESAQDRSVFANIANFDYSIGQNSYEYIILGKGRIAGKRAIAIRMISRDDYRYSYVVWLDIDSYLPLQLDTLDKSNIILEQVMVVSLVVTEQVNPWLEKLSQQQLPQVLHLNKPSPGHASLWKVNWLPTGFKVVKDDLHNLVMKENEPVSYIMINDGIVSVSIYISTKKIALAEKQKIIQRGATVLYTSQKNNIEYNVVGDIPVITAKRLIESITRVQ